MMADSGLEVRICEVVSRRIIGYFFDLFLDVAEEGIT